jgi:hypothetical protein
MEKARTDLQVEELDQLLDELEKLAHSEIPRSKFYSAILERLVFVLNARGAALAVPMGSSRWAPVSICGEIDADAILDEWLGCFPSQSPVADSPEKVFETSTSRITRRDFYSTTHQSITHPLSRIHGADRGILLVQFRTGLSPSVAEEISHLLEAFGDLVRLRQTAELEQFVFQKWPSFQNAMSAVQRSKTMDQAATILVNDLRPVVGADRVSLVIENWTQTCSVAAISGIVALQAKSDSVKSIEQIGRQVLLSGKPLAGHSLPSQALPSHSLPNQAPSQGSKAEFQGVSANFVAVPIGKLRSEAPSDSKCVLLCEWSDYESLLQNAMTLNSVVPTVDWIWVSLQQTVSRSLPQRLLSLLGVNRSKGFLAKPLIRRIALLAAIIAVLLGLHFPVELRIAMNGTLEPKGQRTIYAAMDGIVEQVLVRDNESVQQEQMLLTMRSPGLELQIQEVHGELKGNSEKRDSLALSLNQLAQQSSTNGALLNQISAEIRMLESARDSLEAKLVALRAEKRQLDLIAPMNGVVVARDLEQLLGSRPVRRGDALFRIVNPEGPWLLHLEISDSDAGYVLETLNLNGNASRDDNGHFQAGEIEFAIVSKPDLQFQATIVWLANAARNPSGAGVFIDAIADVQPEAIRHGYIGATVQAYMNCGKKPLWFVYSRPLVEAIQRKLWF